MYGLRAPQFIGRLQPVRGGDVAGTLVRAALSTVSVWSDSPYTGTAEGDVWFAGGIRLRLREELDFEAGRITAYGYEVHAGSERLFWYDDFPHPHDLTLAATHPHHKHVPPDIRRHRVPAADISFTRPNLPVLLLEIEALVRQRSSEIPPHPPAARAP